MSWSTDHLSEQQREQIAREHFTVQEQKGDELHGLCPAHDDHNTSFSYNPVKDVCNCLACGFKGDLVSLWGAATGHTDNKESFKAFTTRFGDGTTIAPSSGKKQGGQAQGSKGGAGSDDSITKIIPESDLKKLPSMPDTWRKKCVEKFGWSEAVIDKFDLRIRTIKDETRIAIPIRRDDNSLVNIRLYLPGAAENKLMSWGAGFGKSKLFPSPSTLTELPVLLCEGEKDCLAALSHGFNAITQTSGANSWDAARFNRFFKGRKVIIAYDNDEPGAKGSEKVAKALLDDAGSVWVIQWPAFMGVGDDVADWFTKHGRTAEEFKSLLSDAKQYGKKQKSERSREERASEIAEEQQRYFIGKQFKARRCADHIIEDFQLAFDASSAMLYQWNGKYWEDTHESIIRNRILNLLADEGNTARVNDVCRVVQDLSIIKHGRKFNDKNGLLPLQNGVLDVANGSLVPHDKENLNTYCLDVSPNTENAQDCPLWKKFLDDSIGDPATIKELQKFLGYCYTRETRYEKALYLIGPGGDGKGTIIKVFRTLIGEVNCSTVGMSDMVDQFHRVMLVDKLLNSTTEIRSELFQSDMIKTLISGEPISAAQKHRPAFSFSPVAKHIFSGNTYPDIKDHTDGLYRRLLLIEMDRQFVAAGKADNYLFEKLMEERDGIFLWGLRGLQLLKQEGFTPSETMSSNLDLFKQKNNPLYRFAISHVVQSDAPGVFMPSEDFYDAYRKFCAKGGHQPHSLTNSMMMLQNLFPQIKKRQKRMGGNRFMGFDGLQLSAQVLS